MASASTASGAGAQIGTQPKNGVLRDAQVRSLVSMLNFNDPSFSHTGTSKGTGEGSSAVPKPPPVWKVLIMDPTSTDILSTSLRVQDLRENGVTLHLYVNFLT